MREYLDPAAPQTPPAALYLHVPFCFHKCHYCDFYSIVDKRDRQHAFTERLLLELAALGPLTSSPLTSIFVGGGTPTLLAPEHWERLLKGLADHFDMSAIKAGPGEFSVECNPETATAELMGVLHAGGVNRVSMGAQSFNPVHLKTLERWHDPDNVEKAISLAADAGIARRSIDLIFAIPGQSLADWDADLTRALALPIDHLSCYALTYEPNTAMTARMRKGEFTPAGDDIEAEMYEHTVATLGAHGLHRYEVSNFARPDAECRHNLAYWRQDSWLAAGPSASGHLHGHRWKNIPRLDDYLNFSDDGFAPVMDHEPPEPSRNLVERIMTGIRLTEGLDADAITRAAQALDATAPARLEAELRSHRQAGWLNDDAERWVLTDSGFLFADRVAADLMGAVVG
ncbi:MAG: oxygen-independent coproporphyrinogen-3 oxidase [Phycisphaerales bacterium]